MALVRSSSLRNIVLASLVVPLVGLTVNVGRTEEPAVTIPPPALDATVPAGATSQTIVLAGGCFWGVQAVFQHTKGVTAAVSGPSIVGANPTSNEQCAVSPGLIVCPMHAA